MCYLRALFWTAFPLFVTFSLYNTEAARPWIYLPSAVSYEYALDDLVRTVGILPWSRAFLSGGGEAGARV